MSGRSGEIVAAIAQLKTPSPLVQAELLAVVQICEVVPTPVVELNAFLAGRSRNELRSVRASATAGFRPRFDGVGELSGKTDVQFTKNV